MENISFEEYFSSAKSEDIKEIEITILSCIFNNHFETEDIFINLKPIDFTNKQNKRVYLACEKLKLDGKNYSYLDVLDFFNQNKMNKEIYFRGYHNYIDHINDQYNYEASILNLLNIVQKNSIQKQLQEFGNKLSSIEMDVINYNDKIYEIQSEFLEILNSKKGSAVKMLADILPEYQAKLATIRNNNDSLTGCTSGYPQLDKITHGFQPGDMIVLAARPGIGKTALAINFMLNSAKELHQWNDDNPKEKPKAILFFSMEMGEAQICERLVAAESCVDISTTKKGTWTSIEHFSISEAITRLSQYPIFIDDSSNLSIIEVQSKIKQTSLKYKLELVIIDYLQLLRGPQVKGGQSNRQQEVSSISKIIKDIARQYEVPIIAVAQLSRKVEERKGENRRPILSDLRESGSIEQDADIVSFLSYKVEDENNTQKNNNDCVVEYIISKHRNGETASIDFLFKKSIGKYLSLRNK